MTDQHAELRAAVSDISSAIIETARREAGDGGWSPSLWQALERSGFTLVAVPVEVGGSGGDLHDLSTVLRVAGHQALPVPVAETAVAGMILSRSGLAVPAGPLAVADVAAHPLAVTGDGGDRRVTGRVLYMSCVPATGHLVLLHEDSAGKVGLGIVALGDCSVEAGTNLAGEPRSDVSLPVTGVPLTSARPGSGAGSRAVTALATVARALLMVGAMRRVLELSVAYTGERVQFGRPLNAFQAVQHQLAQLAGAVKQADAICEAAVQALHERRDAADVVAAAKICAGESARQAIEIGHQVHGTIGWTAEYPLHHVTERLIAWRDEDGTDVGLSRVFGRSLLDRGPGTLWDLMTGAGGDRAS